MAEVSNFEETEKELNKNEEENPTQPEVKKDNEIENKEGESSDDIREPEVKDSEKNPKSLTKDTKTDQDNVVDSDKNDVTSKIEELKVKDDVKIDQGQHEEQSPNQWAWGSWKGWGSSMISNAATHVSQLTSQVGDGLMQVLESVDKDEEEEEDVVIENPNKEPITDQRFVSAKDTKSTKDSKLTVDDDATKETVALGTVIEGNKSPWWISGLSNVVNKTTSVLEQTTKTVVHGGLDVLEVVGKRTYNIITEGDHGLKNVLRKNKERKQLPNLSQVLTEAKEISEMRLREEESELEDKKFMYSYWFDEYQGLLQLEAFELLCRENELSTRQEYEKLEGDRLAVAKEALGRLNDVYKAASSEEEEEEEEEDDTHDFGQLLMEYAAKLPVVLNVQKMMQCQEETKKLLEDYEAGKVDKMAAKDLYKEALRCLALLTSLSIQHYHKMAQLLLRSSSSSPPTSSSSPPTSSSSPPESSSSSSAPFAHVSPIETASIIVDFSKVLRKEMTIESNKFVSVLASLELEKEKTGKRSEKKSAGDDEEKEEKDKKDSGDEDKGEKNKEMKGADDDAEDYNDYITSIYLEAANSGKFVGRSLKLLLPVLQIAVLNE